MEESKVEDVRLAVYVRSDCYAKICKDTFPASLADTGGLLDLTHGVSFIELTNR